MALNQATQTNDTIQFGVDFSREQKPYADNAASTSILCLLRAFNLQPAIRNR
jgi:hypothetical protein